MNVADEAVKIVPQGAKVDGKLSKEEFELVLLDKVSQALQSSLEGGRRSRSGYSSVSYENANLSVTASGSIIRNDQYANDELRILVNHEREFQADQPKVDSKVWAERVEATANIFKELHEKAGLTSKSDHPERFQEADNDYGYYGVEERGEVPITYSGTAHVKEDRRHGHAKDTSVILHTNFSDVPKMQEQIQEMIEERTKALPTVVDTLQEKVQQHEASRFF